MPLTLIGFIGTAAGFVSTITFFTTGNKNMANQISKRSVFANLVTAFCKCISLAYLWYSYK